MHIRTVLTVLTLCAALQGSDARLRFLRSEFAVDGSALSETNTPGWLVDASANGDLEIRQQILFDGPGNRVVVRTFTVAPGSAAITPLVVAQEALLERYKIAVDRMAVAFVPDRVIEIEGIVTDVYKMHVTGAELDRRVFLRLRFEDGGAALSALEIAIPDAAAMLSAAWPAGSVGFGAEMNLAPIARAGADVETGEWEVRLDASTSIDPEGTELDYKWRVLSGSAALRGCETVSPVLQMVGGPGVYEVEVMVTDAEGASATDTLLIIYLGR